VNDGNQPGNPVRIDVVQGGLYHDDLVNNVRSIPHEPTIKTGIRHRNGVISMARNEPGTASSEFFICIGNQPELDYGGDRNPDGEGFAAFGKVIRGMKVIRKIHALPDSGQYLIQPIVITGELR
jgi:peptidyl-prolyl cis-trans isomerase A (cyclophilin A)